ncbi:MAG: hypothetical protein MUP66_00630 [Candidatus Nanohaloarchaeota archaeon QJJ-5]|nr:hypothetical protein [Candidatus Nanohaloarchaeota archaeon QJJ-5]
MDEGQFMDLLQERENGESERFEAYLDDLVATQYLEPVEEEGEVIGYEPTERAETVLEWTECDTYENGLLYEK